MKMSELLKIEDNKENLENIRANHENIIPFIGAGVSAAYGYPTWKELLEKLSCYYLEPEEQANLNDCNLIEYAQKIVGRVENINIIVDTIRKIYNKCEKRKSEIGYVLLKSFSKSIVTTNYDTILENILNDINGFDNVHVFLPFQREKMTQAIKTNQTCILKMHGSIDEASSIIFSSLQYDEAYGKGKIDISKPVPNFLSSIFNGKSVLFIGCSLSQDRTMEVLSACLDNNEYIKNYAIVELPEDKRKIIEQRIYLATLGIIPIYYPAGQYECVELLVNYLAGENTFIRIVKKIIDRYVDISDSQYNLMCSILNEAYYKTATEYPEILNFNVGMDTFVENVLEIMKNLSPDQSLYGICLIILNMLSKIEILGENSIKKSLMNHFYNAIFRETDIVEFMQIKHSIYAIPHINIYGKTNKEITALADQLNRKIQYENDRDYSVYYINYNQAVELLDMAYDKIEIRQRLMLCNSVGAGYVFLKDTRKAVYYLECAIDELCHMEQPLLSLLSKCYCNMSIIQAKKMDNPKTAIEYIKKDLKIKCKINDNKRLVAGSLGHLALYEAEVVPFNAIDRYIEVIELKRKNIDDAEKLRFEREKEASVEAVKKKMILSWATSIFNLSLLLKDLSLYDEAKKLMEIANYYRYKYISQNNFDYTASINSNAELDICLGNLNIDKNIEALQARIEMSPELTSTLFHSYYVCALYFYYKRDYETAIKYIKRYKLEYYINDNIQDIRLSAKVAIIIMKILIKQNKIEKAKGVYKDIISRMVPIYGEDSIWIKPLRSMYIKISNIGCIYSNIEEDDMEKVGDVKRHMELFYEQIMKNLP